VAVIAPLTHSSAEGPVTIRSATEADAAAVVSLLTRAFAETEFLSRLPEEAPPSSSGHDALLRRVPQSPVELFLVATLDNAVIAIATLKGSTLQRFAHSAELAVAVAKDHWRRGIGSALMRALLDWADHQGLIRLWIEVVETNERAIRLYETLGFELEGRLRARRRHGDQLVDNLLMARVLLDSPLGVETPGSHSQRH
jgi:RimJ/RimL family protein N-acetyltransferase